MGKGSKQTFLQRRHTNGWCIQDAGHHQSLGKHKSQPQWDTTSHPLKWLSWKILSVGEDVKKLELSDTAGGNVKRYSSFCKQSGRSSDG